MNVNFARPMLSAMVVAAGAMCSSSFVLAQSDGHGITPRHGSPASDKTTHYPNGIIHIAPVSFGITQAVRDLPTSVPNAAELAASAKPKEANPLNKKVIKPIIPGAGAGAGPEDFKDPLVDRSRAFITLPAMPTPTSSFDGATQVDNAAQGIGAISPPDVNGDVGLNHYVSSVNLVYKIFNKDGTVAAGPFRTNALFSGLPAIDPCRTTNSGDPIVVYDSLADRWHISQFGITGATNYQCVALSVTGDPTGAYYLWSYAYPNQMINDYPKVGVWTDAYHMTFNQFNNAGTSFLGMGILSQDRPRALAGDPAASVVYTNIATIDPSAGGGLPADIDGFVPPPAGMAVVIAEMRANEFGDPLDAIRYYRWVPNFVTPASSTISVLPDVALASYDARAPATRLAIEVSGGSNVDAMADRLMHRFAYRNLGTQAAPVNSFVGNFTVNVSGVSPTTAGTFQAGIRWFEMRRTGDAFTVFDQGTHNLAPGNGASGVNNWMGSIAQDNKGNLALGFSQSSTTQRADIKIAGRTINTLNSGILNEGESTFMAAGGSQVSTAGRWGDYSAMNVDPVDDCTFWYTQEYYATGATNTNWSTRVGSFKFPSCTPPPRGTIQGTITICSSGAPVNLALVSATGGFSRATSATGTYSMSVTPATYTLTASTAVQGFISTSQSGVTVANGGTVTVNLCLTGTPVLAAAAVSLISESFLPPNGVIDPGETVTVSFGAQNVGAANTVNDVGTLQATGGVTAPGAAQNYGVVVAGGAAVSRNLTFTAAPALACGANITASVAHQDGASNLSTLAYSLATGVVGTPTTFSYTGPAVAIPDNVVAGVNIPLVVSGVVGNIADVNFRLDALAGCSNAIGDTNASVTHTFTGDLRFKLTSPAGTTVSLIANRGSSGNNFCTVTLDDDGTFPPASTFPTVGAVTGNFSPESPLSAFDGQNANGTWILNVADVAGTDTGTLNRFSLIIAGRTCAAPPPIVYNVVLEGAQEVPLVSPAGSGSGTVTVDTANNLISWNINYGGLTSAVAATHLHGPAARGVNAGVKIPIASTASPLTGSATYLEVDEADILGGNWYVNIHTVNNPGGEIRGQVDNLGSALRTLTVSKAGAGAGTVTSSPAGINCGATCSAGFAVNSVVTLTAAANAGSSFTGWSGGGCAGTGTCVVTMSAAQTVTATFAALVIAKPNDLSGDGKSDLIWQHPDGTTAASMRNGLLESSGGYLAFSTSGLTAKHIADFDGDGRADILWELTDGSTYMALMNGATNLGGAFLTAAGSPWRVSHVADFNGDGKADLVWKHSDNTIAVSIRNGLLETSGGYLAFSTSGLSLKHTGDFDGDGRADILWELTDGSTYMALMSGAANTSGAFLQGAGSPWRVSHVADFNGDGKSDLVWKHSDGTIAVSIRNGLLETSGGYLAFSSSGLSLKHTGDFNGDGTADILWELTDGSTYMALMNGVTNTSGAFLTSAGSPLSVRRVGDYNGDGKTDIIWQHTDGSTYMALMDGAVQTSGAFLTAAGSVWRVMP